MSCRPSGLFLTAAFALGALLASASAPAQAGTRCTSSRHPALADKLETAIELSVLATVTQVDTVALAFYDRISDTTCERDATRQFKSASTIKATILAGLLLKAQSEGNRDLDVVVPPGIRTEAAQRSGDPSSEAQGFDTEAELAKHMITESSNSAAMALWIYLRRESSIDWVQRFVSRDVADMADTRLADPAGGFGTTLITARDQVKLMRHYTVDTGRLIWKYRKIALDLMGAVNPRQRWGVSSSAPMGAHVHLKTGFDSLSSGATDPDRFLNVRTHAVGSIDGYAANGRAYDYMMALLSERNAAGTGIGVVRLNVVGFAINSTMWSDGGLFPLRTLQFNVCGSGDGFGCASNGLADTPVMRVTLGRILEFAPDFVTLNEVCRHQFDWLRKSLAEHERPMHGSFAPTLGSTPRCSDGGPLGNAVLSWTPILLPFDFDLPSAGAESSKLICALTNIETKNVVACATQLNKNRDVALTQMDRVTHVVNGFHDRGWGVLLGGDMNVRPFDAALDALYTHNGGRGVFRESDDSGAYQNFGNCSPFVPFCRSGEPTFRDGFSKLDYIFLNSAFAYLDADVRPFDFPSATGSDHRPLYALSIFDPDRLFLISSVKPAAVGVPSRNLAPTVSAGRDVSGFEGSAVELNGTVHDVDSTPAIRWSYSPGDDVDAGATCTFGTSGAAATTFTCTDDGTFTVTLTADDGVNSAVSDSAVVTIRNLPPVLTLAGPTPWKLFRKGEPVSVSGSFTDPGANDSHRCAVEWDDGSQETLDAGPGRTCQQRHVFDRAGMFTIKASVTDDDGGVGFASVMVIVYDPLAGTPSGNGWIDRARNVAFNFLASYPTAGASLPHGSVTFSRITPALTFRTLHDIQWLVVTPDHKVAIKGTGELLPGQAAGFLLYADHAAPNKLRMVIWDAAEGDIPEGVPALFDNGLHSSFDIDRARLEVVEAGTLHIARR